jgi:N-acetylglutamate synthase-like GNAT family acetyltransferase
VLWAYFADVVGRFWGRPASAEEIAAAMADEPSDDLTLFWVAEDEGAVVGCAGLRVLEGEVGEVTRVFVAPGSRRRGVATRLLQAVEEAALARDLGRLQLDTRADLVEARQFYTKLGYEEVPGFNDSRYAEHWFAKPLR